MQKQIHSAGKRGFFSKKSLGPQAREKFTLEDMLCFQKVILFVSCGIMPTFVCLTFVIHRLFPVYELQFVLLVIFIFLNFHLCLLFFT